MLKLTKKQLDERIKSITDYISEENAASGSKMDANANVDSKNVTTMGAETNKDIDIQINRELLRTKIVELFGEDTSERYRELLEGHSIYSHDESNILKPYCMAIDLYPFIQNGLVGLGGGSKAPKHLISFCGGYVNLVFAISAQMAGALADVSFLHYFDYFARKDYGDKYLETHTDLIKSCLQQVIYTINQPAAARGWQSVFYNTSIFDENYFKTLFGTIYYPDGTQPSWDSVKVLQEFFMTWFNKERTKALLTFPVVTAAFLTKDGFAKDLEFKNLLTTQMSEGNSFFLYSSDTVDSLSSCCRLKSSIKNQFTYTLGGTGISTGSKKVFTINLNRVAQDSTSEINFLENLKAITEDLHKFLVAYNELLYFMKSAKMLPVYDCGFISLEKQYLTIGINGMVEAAEFYGYKISDNIEYKKFIIGVLKVISATNKIDSEVYSKQFNKTIQFNTEFVPAENLGVKFAKWDKKDGYKANRDCYNSYLYIVEDSSLDFIDKFNLHSKDILEYLDGGSAYHLNLDEIPTKETWEKIIDIATLRGCNYWTYNVRSTCCNSCGFISKEDRVDCPECGSKDVDYATRVIGYLKKIKSFAKERKKEANNRYYS